MLSDRRGVTWDGNSRVDLPKPAARAAEIAIREAVAAGVAEEVEAVVVLADSAKPGITDLNDLRETRP